MRSKFRTFLGLTTCLCSLAQTYASRENVVFFMVDDLGWNHIQALKGTMGTSAPIYQTPNIERLAQRGLSFTYAYAQPNCAPTRAAILSGQYPARIHNDVYVVSHLNRHGRGGITAKEARFVGPEQTEDVAAEAVTLAEALRENGYATAHIGKYHVGGHEGGDSTMPLNAGFDINIGGSRQGHQPTCFASKKQGEWGFKNLGNSQLDSFAASYTASYLSKRNLPAMLKGKPKHISDAMGDALEMTIGQLSAGEKPFYLQFHTYAVHGPVRARPDLLKAAKTQFPEQSDKMAHYLGFIKGVDENVGRLLAALEDPNGDGDPSDSITEKTLVVFTSDNGGTHTGSAPLRGEKGMFTEGGIRVPLIASLPGQIPFDTVTEHLVHSVDFYPTFVELAGNQWLPSEKIHPLDGASFYDVLLQPEAVSTREPIYYLFPGYMDTRAQPCAVVLGELQSKRYKLSYTYETETWELYCISDDIAETKNLITSHPEVASTLSKKLRAWLTQEHSTWQPKYPLLKSADSAPQSAGPPPLL
ncbi:MAG: sulfatase [Opitutaceae bacterium]